MFIKSETYIKKKYLEREKSDIQDGFLPEFRMASPKDHEEDDVKTVRS